MRIRSIKPEFWMSESISRLSRDARLLFIGLWNFADDEGRGRGALPLIANTLFPYDSDAIKKISKWFAELEKQEMVKRYKGNDGNQYFCIPSWQKHQCINRPTPSKLPEYNDSMGTHEPLTEDSLSNHGGITVGTGNREQGTGNREHEYNKPAEPTTKTKTIAEKYIDSVNGITGRKGNPIKTILPEVEKRLRQGIEPWKIIAAPLILKASTIHPGLWKRENIYSILLRDGSKPVRGINGGPSQPGVDWINSAIEAMDTVHFDAQKVVIAIDLEIWHELEHRIKSFEDPNYGQ